MHSRRTLIASFVLVSASNSVTAEQSEHADALDEIVVTASKMGQTNLQETPITISAFDDAALESSQVSNIEDLASLVPSLFVSQNTGSARVYLRGVGSDTDFVGADASITVHMDGIYLSRPQSVFNDFLDTGQVEVLRGPQGTLYGRNSIGGTINIISKLPSAESTSKVALELGNYSKVRALGTVTGELATNLFGSVSLAQTQRDGYVDNENSVGDSDLNDDDTFAGKGTLRYIASDNDEFVFRIDSSTEDSTGVQYKPTHLSVLGAPITFSPLPPTVITPTTASGERDVNIPFSPALERTSSGTSMHYTHDFSDTLTLTSITAYRTLENEAFIDSDWSDINSRQTFLEEDQDQLSQEFQLTGTAGDITWLTGFYYFDESNDFDGEIEIQDALFPPTTATALSTTTVNINDAYDAEALAIFGQVNYAISEQLNIIFGLRYTDEQKDYTFSNSLANSSINNAVFAETPSTDHDDSWDAWTPKLGIDYTISDEMMVYGVIAKGFKSGGFNATTNEESFDQEELVSVEIGLKADWLDNKLRTNLSLFSYDYDDLQVQGFVIAAGAAPRVTIENAAKASVEGLELEIIGKPNENWLFSSAISFLDAEYDDYISIDDRRAGDLSGNDMISTPDFSITLGANYFHYCDNGDELTLKLEYYSQSEVFFTAYNDDTTGQDDFDLINFYSSYTFSNTNLEISLFGKNLADEDYTTASQDFSPTGVALLITPPRTYGVMAAYEF